MVIRDAYFTSAIKLPIIIIDSGMVIFPTISRPSEIILGQLIGDKKIIKPVIVETIPGFKNKLFHLTPSLFLLNRYIPYDHINNK